MKITLLACTLAATIAAGPATAGLLDSPPPSFTAGAGKIVYRMGPVFHDPGWVGTYVACTNIGGAPTEIAIEVFDELDDRVAEPTRATIAAGARVTFVAGAGDAAAAPDTVAITALPELDHGKARVSAPTAALACTAWLRIASADGGVKEVPLELVKKVAVGG